MKNEEDLKKIEDVKTIEDVNMREIVAEDGIGIGCGRRIAKIGRAHV